MIVREQHILPGDVSVSRSTRHNLWAPHPRTLVHTRAHRTVTLITCLTWRTPRFWGGRSGRERVRRGTDGGSGGGAVGARSMWARCRAHLSVRVSYKQPSPCRWHTATTWSQSQVTQHHYFQSRTISSINFRIAGGSSRNSELFDFLRP